MEVAEPFRRKGYGSYLVQELKRVCRGTGHIPAARCGTGNSASQRALQRAGMLPCARIVKSDCGLTGTCSRGAPRLRLFLLFASLQGVRELFDLVLDAEELLAMMVHVLDHLLKVDAKLLHPEEAEFDFLLLLLDVFQLHRRSVTRRTRLSPVAI